MTRSGRLFSFPPLSAPPRLTLTRLPPSLGESLPILQVSPLTRPFLLSHTSLWLISQHSANLRHRCLVQPELGKGMKKTCFDLFSFVYFNYYLNQRFFFFLTLPIPSLNSIRCRFLRLVIDPFQVLKIHTNSVENVFFFLSPN